MKTYGLKEKQELVSIALDDESNPLVNSLKPSDAGDDWVPPEIVPLVKLPQPVFNSSAEYCEPRLVWFDDKVERHWDIKPLPPEKIDAELQKQKLAALYAPFVVSPEGYALGTTEEDQNAFTRLLTLLNLAGASDVSETSILDTNNNLHVITFARLKQVMLSYGTEVQRRWVEYKQ